MTIFLQVGRTTDVDITYISPEGFVFVHVSMAGSKRLEEVNNDLNEYYTSKVMLKWPTLKSYCYVFVLNHLIYM